jgi:hypothetical protein
MNAIDDREINDEGSWWLHAEEDAMEKRQGETIETVRMLV